MKYYCPSKSKIKINQYKSLNNYSELLQKINDYTKDEASLYCPFDKINIQKIIQLSKKYSFAKNVILIGIGGSSLGTLAIAQALKVKKNLIVFDTLSSLDIEQLKICKSTYTDKNTVIIIVSKSGSTTETIVNAQVVLQTLPKLKKNTVFITDENSKICNLAKSLNNDIIFIPKKVGGRFSVFSPVGVFPLAILGVNIKELIKGARDSIKTNTKINSPAYLNSINIYNKTKLNNLVNNYFLFNKSLETLGKWVVQLESESLGKDKKGYLTNFSIGSNDLHSVYQLYLEGGLNIYTNFVNTNFDSKLKTNKSIIFKNLIEDIEGKSVKNIFDSIYLGVKKSYTKNNMPFAEFNLKINEYEIAYLMQTLMIQTMYLGKLIGVNAYNQPGVEFYKEETRKILKKSS